METSKSFNQEYFENYNLLLNTKFTVWDLVI